MVGTGHSTVAPHTGGAQIQARLKNVIAMRVYMSTQRPTQPVGLMYVPHTKHRAVDSPTAHAQHGVSPSRGWSRLIAAPRGLHGDVTSPDDERACVRAGQSDVEESESEGPGARAAWVGAGVMCRCVG